MVWCKGIYFGKCGFCCFFFFVWMVFFWIWCLWLEVFWECMWLFLVLSFFCLLIVEFFFLFVLFFLLYFCCSWEELWFVIVVERMILFERCFFVVWIGLVNVLCCVVVEFRKMVWSCCRVSSFKFYFVVFFFFVICSVFCSKLILVRFLIIGCICYCL